VTIRSLLELPKIPDVEEDGATLEENAIKKAQHAHKYTGLPCLADDSGLEVYVLNMEPGVRSARYAGVRVTYADNNRKLIEALKDIPESKRTAQFRCVSAFVDRDQTKIAEGICRGRIGFVEVGSGGFGYDPLFIPDGFDMTFAQLDAGTKNSISHRGMALREMRGFLESYFRGKDKEHTSPL